MDVETLIFICGIYLAVMMFFVYVMICGNNKFHRNGIIGSIYRFISIKVPFYFRSLTLKICPKLAKRNEDEDIDNSCMGPHGKCRYFVAIFFYTIYMIFSITYFSQTFPNLKYVYPNSYKIREFFSFFVLPWPWVIFVALQFLDPGEITNENVQSYLQVYPYDNVIYKPSLCRTLKIPVVPRSRYCQYTNKRIAKYDHYCPWVLATIGERTHRFFLLFLIFDIIAASYLAFHSYKQMAWRIDKLSPRIRWDPDLKMRNFFICVAVIMRTDLFTAANFVILSVIVVVLTFFVGQVCYFISINVTQIEIDKYEAVKEYRAKIGNKEPVRNFYSKGFIGNWKSFWFPPKIVKHQPMEYSIEGDNIVGKPMKTADENRKSLPRNKRSKK